MSVEIPDFGRLEPIAVGKIVSQLAWEVEKTEYELGNLVPVQFIDYLKEEGARVFFSDVMADLKEGLDFDVSLTKKDVEDGLVRHIRASVNFAPSEKKLSAFLGSMTRVYRVAKPLLSITNNGELFRQDDLAVRQVVFSVWKTALGTPQVNSEVSRVWQTKDGKTELGSVLRKLSEKLEVRDSNEK